MVLVSAVLILYDIDLMLKCTKAKRVRVMILLLVLTTSSNEAQRFQILGRFNGVLTASILNFDQEASTGGGAHIH